MFFPRYVPMFTSGWVPPPIPSMESEPNNLSAAIQGQANHVQRVEVAWKAGGAHVRDSITFRSCESYGLKLTCLGSHSMLFVHTKIIDLFACLAILCCVCMKIFDTHGNYLDNLPNAENHSGESRRIKSKVIDML